MKFDFASVNPGATAWVLVSAAFVLLMTPGLAFFYGGMVRAKNVLSMLTQCFVAMALVSVVWMAAGFSLAYGKGNALIGDLNFLGLANMDQIIPGFVDSRALTIPPIVFAVYQLMFAIITAAIITGATAERFKFGTFVSFIVLWSLLVYAPVAHWVFSPEGWAAELGALDFAGGTVVHVSSGAAALAMAITLGRRRGWPDDAFRPHNLPFVMLGAALLWFGWFGFNAGSAFAADNVAGYAFANTNTAAAAGLLSWMAVEKVKYGRATSLGAASGAVSGLVAITPCAGYVSPVGSVAIGFLAGMTCALAVRLKTWIGWDDALDVAGVHLVAGLVGSLCVGLFATTIINPEGADGLFYGGAYSLLGKQAIVCLAVMAYSFAVTLVLGKFLGRVVGNRVRAREEIAGIDLSIHGEVAYDGIPPDSHAVPGAVTGPQPVAPSPAGGSPTAAERPRLDQMSR